jgi:hypothetical protein
MPLINNADIVRTLPSRPAELKAVVMQLPALWSAYRSVMFCVCVGGGGGLHHQRRDPPFSLVQSVPRQRSGKDRKDRR